MRLGVGARQAYRQPELEGEIDVDVEELRLDLHGAHVGVEVAHVETPEDGPLDLCPAFPAHFIEVGVVPHVFARAGEPAVAVEEGRGVGDGPPPVEVEFGVDGEMDADVLSPVGRRRPTRPGRGHHEAGAGGDPVAQCVVDGEVGGVAQPQVVTGQ